MTLTTLEALPLIGVSQNYSPLFLNERLTLFCDNSELLKYNQVGFRRGFRTTDHIFTLKTMIDQSLNKKEKLYACFVDFRKAYDTVWRKGLFLKLLESGISGKFVKLLQDIYSGLQLCVSLNNGLSSPFKSLVGLKQGCNLSPLLFNIFINDIPNIIDNATCDPPALEGQQISCLLYADDLVLLSKSRSGLQNSIDALYDFTKDWFLEINKTKTKCLVFSRGREQRILDFKLNGSLIQTCREYCYLGVLFTRSGAFKSAARALNDKAVGAMFSIIRNLYKHRSVDIRTMFNLFDKMVLPIAMYGSEVWGTNYIPVNSNNNDFFGQPNLSKHDTEILHYRYMKLLLGVPRKTANWAVKTETGRYPTIMRAMKAMIKYYFHLGESKSPFVISALAANKNMAGMGSIHGLKT